MINVARGDAPSEVKEALDGELERAVKLFNELGRDHWRVKNALEKGYQCARVELWHRQHKKCVYCEDKTALENQPTEHFRPKKRAQRSWRGDQPKEWDTDRYWWLAWTWGNLFFACHGCNTTKGDAFPLKQGSESLPVPEPGVDYPLPDHCFDLTIEHPLLVDPGNPKQDPLNHLRWRPIDRRASRSMWIWKVDGRTLAGKATVRILGLESRSPKVDDIYCSIWRAFNNRIDKQAHHLPDAALRAAWDKLVRDEVDPKRGLTVARWCILDELRQSSKMLKTRALPEPPRPWRPGQTSVSPL